MQELFAYPREISDVSFDFVVFPPPARRAAHSDEKQRLLFSRKYSCFPAEVLVYGASVIHHSKRPLLQNYYNFTHVDDEKTRERGLFLSEPNDENSHYSIYEDKHGTHIFINNDIDMMTKLSELVEHHFTHWKLDGIYCPGDNFVEIAKLFVKARDLMQEGTFSQDQAFLFDEEIHRLHPIGRGLDTGFYDFDPDTVK